jgi:hypothetical protein
VCSGVPPVSEEDLDVGHEALDDVDECCGEVDFVKHLDDEGVVDGVKCFGCVEEEDVELLFSVEGGVVVLCNGEDVISTLSFGDKPFLIWS